MKFHPASRWVVAMALLLVGYGAADTFAQGGSAAGADGTTIVAEGVERRQSVPSAAFINPSPGRAVRSLSSQPPAPVSPRVVPLLRGPAPVELPPVFPQFPPGGSGPIAGAVPVSLFSPESLAPIPRAPSLLSSFIGLVDDLKVVPPDTMGAAGPNHLISFLNSEVGFFTKTGTLLNPGVSLRDFWLPLISANNLPDNSVAPTVFDPKVLYDAGSGRFLAVTLNGSLPTDNSSWILIAVSHSSDPTAGWNTWAIAADNTGATWADYPGLGVDDNNVYITANMFNAVNVFQRGKTFRIPKAQLLASPQTTTLSWTEFTSSRFNLQPAHTFGNSSVEYLITESNTVLGGRRFLDVFTIAGTPSALVSQGSVEVASYPVVSSMPVAPQTRIDTSDTRILNAVFRNGHLYATHTVSDNTNTRTEAAWYEIVPSSPPSLVQQGRVSDPMRFYYYPSIAVNANGDIAIGFSGSSATEFPGGYYTARLASDAAGFTQSVGLLKSGEDAYSKPLGGTDSRWGDFSATVVDPSDDLTFWTIQEYARTSSPAPTPNPGRWGTWWGSFRISGIGAPANLVATATGPFEVQLSWIPQSTNETGFRVERKTGASGTYAVITSPPLPPGTTSYTDNSVLSGTTYFYRVQSFNATDSAYSAEAAATTAPLPPPPSSGGGGCLSITRSGGEVPFGTSLFSVGILLLPAFTLGLRRFFRRREGTVPIRHPLC